MRISDWSSDVCSSDLAARCEIPLAGIARSTPDPTTEWPDDWSRARSTPTSRLNCAMRAGPFRRASSSFSTEEFDRSEEHTSELQSLMRISYAVFCLKKKQTIIKYI